MVKTLEFLPKFKGEDIRSYMASRNSFEIVGDHIYIRNPRWNGAAVATVRDDYIDEIQSVTWGLSNGYVHNQQLGYLHRYIMSKWYGESVLDSMTEADYVVDHMDNDGFNCSIDNLSFLSNAENKAKGLTFDQLNKDKMHIALSIFKDFSTGLYQTTIFFNYPPTLTFPGIDDPAYIQLAYLLYGNDYSTMLLDSSQILNEYYKSYTFSPEYLRCDDYHIEGTYGKVVSVEEYDRIMNASSMQPKVAFVRRGYIQGWKPEDKKEFFYLHPKLR